MESTYLTFEHICKTGTYDDIQNFITNNNIDINHDDNFYVEMLVRRGKIEFLELIKQHNGNLHDKDETLIHITGLLGFIDCLEYLINDCDNDNGNWKSILDTNAYNNCIRTKHYIDKLTM